MPRGKKGTRKPAPKSGAAMKYDAHASALDDAYGMLAELRRELSDTREAYYKGSFKRPTISAWRNRLIILMRAQKKREEKSMPRYCYKHNSV